MASDVCTAELVQRPHLCACVHTSMHACKRSKHSHACGLVGWCLHACKRAYRTARVACMHRRGWRGRVRGCTCCSSCLHASPHTRVCAHTRTLMGARRHANHVLYARLHACGYHPRGKRHCGVVWRRPQCLTCCLLAPGAPPEERWCPDVLPDVLPRDYP